MTFDDLVHVPSSLESAWNQLEEIDPSERLHPQVLGLRPGVLKGLERWQMGAEIARGAVRAFPDNLMLYVMGAFHVPQHEGVQAALEFFSNGEPYLSGDGWSWYQFSRHPSQCDLSDPAKISLARAIMFDPKIRELAATDERFGFEGI